MRHSVAHRGFFHKLGLCYARTVARGKVIPNGLTGRFHSLSVHFFVGLLLTVCAAVHIFTNAVHVIQRELNKETIYYNLNDEIKILEQKNPSYGMNHLTEIEDK